jgi:hypothetical protein
MSEQPDDDTVMVGEGRPSTTLLITARKDVDGRPSPTLTGEAKSESQQ